jgi:hypothetical protein
MHLHDENASQFPLLENFNLFELQNSPQIKFFFFLFELSLFEFMCQ